MTDILNENKNPFPTEPNYLLTDEEKSEKKFGKSLEAESTLYFDLTDLINHVRFMSNVNGIQRVIFEFAKHISSFKNTRFFYLNPFDGETYYFDDLDVTQENDLSFLHNAWFLNVDSWSHSQFLNLLLRRLENSQSLKTKMIRKLLPITSLPVLSKLFIALSKRYLRRRFPVSTKHLVHQFDNTEKGDVIAIFGGVWNFQKQYEGFFQQHKDHAFFVHYLHDMIPLVKENIVPTHLNTIFKDYLTYVLQCSHLLVTSSENNITDLHTVSDKYHPSFDIPKAVALGLFYGFYGHDQSEPKHSDLRPIIRTVSEQNFVLCVGSIEPRKNHMVLLQAWRKYIFSDMYNGEILVIAGGWGHEVEELKQALHFAGHLCGSIIVVERPSDIELVTLYKRCRFTVYPSHYEGWGLPISESLYFAKPVVHFRNSCLTEVSAGAAYVVEDCQGLEKAISDLFANDSIYKFYCDRLNQLKAKLPTWTNLSERILRTIYENK
jgi:glycosyltransferase involved in cell wall biosynthesis